MKFAIALASLVLMPFALAAPRATEASTTAAYDTVYDGSSTSLDEVACSNGANGLETAGYTDLGSLPTFPNIGAGFAITEWNSVNCGTCWELTYTNTKGVAKSLNITAIDVATTGFVLSETALNTLTGNQAVALGRVDVTYKQLASSACGL